MKTLQAKHTTALILETIEGVQQIETNPRMWETFHLDNDRSVTVALIEISSSPFVPNIVSLLETLLPLIASPELFYHISEMEGGVDITLSDIELDDDDVLEIESIRLMDDDDFPFPGREEDEENEEEEEHEEQDDDLLPDDDEPSFENLPAENPVGATGGELEFDIEDEPAPAEVTQVQGTQVAEAVVKTEVPAELEFETEAAPEVQAEASAEVQTETQATAPVAAPVEVQAEASAEVQTDHRMIEMLEALQKEGADAILIDNIVTLSDKNNALLQITLGEKQILNKTLPSFTLSSDSDSDRSFLAIDALVRHVKNFHM